MPVLLRCGCSLQAYGVGLRHRPRAVAIDPKQSPLQGLRDRILGDGGLELTARDLMDT